MPLFPAWLHLLCTVTLVLGALCALILLIDVLQHTPHMAIMGFVWPLCALFGTVFVLWLYFRYGRETDRLSKQATHEDKRPSMAGRSQPYAITVAKGTLHCGAGCTLGDIVAEWLAFLIPPVVLAFGWESFFSQKMYAVWILDFLIAFVFGIVFQYFAIVPMRKLSPSDGIAAALKADSLSLISWQIGMYCLMAVLQFAVFKRFFGHEAPVDSVEFWGAMQLAMLAGFVTSYPMNWWLIRIGIKEGM
jgi:hypothetical protein